MARLSTPSSPSSRPSEASKRFQLPAQKEPRTQASTMFTTTARNLTSDVPFRWRQGQVETFEDWNVKNSDGQSVHDLILDQVRRKIARTKDTIYLPVEHRKEVQAKAEEMQVEVEKGVLREKKDSVMPTAPVRVNDCATMSEFLRVTSPSSKDHPALASPWYDDETTGVDYGFFDPWFTSPPAANCVYENLLAFIPPEQSLPATKQLPSPPADRLSATASRVSYGRSERAMHSEAPSAIHSRVTGSQKTKRLEVCMEALVKAMNDVRIEIRCLGYDDASKMGTHARDTAIEVAHLEKVVRIKFLRENERV
ncbi:hypothetical protein F5Y03DRAFT_394511 [Xylaria venustula]|nr:hypothetical protein F5Y03DRAFT_394511 [Xylaria venustula]